MTQRYQNSSLRKNHPCKICLVFKTFDTEGVNSERCLVSQLLDVTRSSTVEQMQRKEEIHIPWGNGIVGHVAQHRESLNISDCYKDDRFNNQIDLSTGYKTHNMLCMPILDVDGEVKGVAQVINKRGGKEPFTVADERINFVFVIIRIRLRPFFFVSPQTLLSISP
ncbi:cGMP-specific 3',5'-cyclic phosphodiesterase [Caerostris extrusa]|uniref:cGMP-specific 3',5'-cyclic phosphodiesterase n=1 Tax=Caerostris extrusa TaxID=172846 RepID=A0AAV4TRX2_CAEEX|nr:cGMP-specific 3',5'-cyclic phosphodiesterase [Caerostris extrusa]